MAYPHVMGDRPAYLRRIALHRMVSAARDSDTKKEQKVTQLTAVENELKAHGPFVQTLRH